jgi:hypothetical protein
MFEKIDELRSKYKEKMSELVKSEVNSYVREYFKENPSVTEIKIEGDESYDDQGNTRKVVFAKVKLDKKLDIDNDADDTVDGHEEMIQEDLHDLADEIYSNVNRAWKRN